MHRDVEPNVVKNGFQDGASFLPAGKKLNKCDDCEYKAKSKPDEVRGRDKTVFTDFT